MIAKLRQWIREYKADRAYGRAESAVRMSARLASEAEFHRRMSDWYDARVKPIDPYTDWNEFAQLMQKHHDHAMDFQRYQQRADEAQAMAEARIGSR